MSSTSSYPDPNAIKLVNNTDGNAISYQCEYLLAYNNTFQQEVIPAYYNLAYPCSGNSSTSDDNNTAFALRAVKKIEEKLLENAALTWSIHPEMYGKGCSDPSLQAYETILVAVSSMPKDEIASSSLKCRSIPSVSSATQPICCSVVESQMTFTPQGVFKPLDLIKFVADQFDSGTLTEGASYATSYAGSFSPPLNQASDTIDSSGGRNPAGAPQQPMTDAITNGETQQTSNKFTPIGGVVLGGLVTTFLVFVVMIVRRRRRWRIDEREVYGMKDEHDLDDDDDDASAIKTRIAMERDDLQNHSLMELGGATIATDSRGAGETFEVSVLSDDRDLYTANGDGSHRNNFHGQQAPSSPPRSPLNISALTMPPTGSQTPTGNNAAVYNFKDPYVEIQPTVSKSDSYDTTNDMDSIDSNSNDNNPQHRYTGFAFDLGQSFKNDIMRKHSTTSHRNFAGNNANAPTMIAVVPPYPMMEETSDSEVDSWAQTDGTVGSLEERLEDITAEI